MQVPTSPLDLAIVYTVLYGDIFNFPMTPHEIHHFLIGKNAEFSEVEQALKSPSGWLATYIERYEQDAVIYFALPGRGIEVFPSRQRCEEASSHLWKKGCRYGIWLGRLPFVRMVALTGALAMRNARTRQDDLDYLLVVKEGRVWLARLFAVALVRLCKLWHVKLCPNYVLSETRLAQEEKSLFMAHEITQMVPLVGFELYAEMRRANEWVAESLPNAEGTFYAQEKDGAPRHITRGIQRTIEFLLGGALGNRLEKWEHARKLRKLQPQAQVSQDAHLSAEAVKGHFMDYSRYTFEQFQQRLAEFGLPPLEDSIEAPVSLPVFSPAAD